MNIVKELQKTAGKNYANQLKDAEQVLESVKANLDIEDKKDKEMLRYFGTDLVVNAQKEKVKKVSRFIEGGFVTFSDIKKVCIKYHLRFLNVSYYKKEVPLSALNDIRKFKEKFHISDSDMARNLMVIAPASHFALGPKPKKDPVLLYRENDVYKIVSTWGNDFHWSRKFKWAFLSLLLLLTCLSVIAVCNAILPIIIDKRELPEVAYLLNIIIILIAAAIVQSRMSLSADYWNKPYK